MAEKIILRTKLPSLSEEDQAKYNTVNKFLTSLESKNVDPSYIPLPYASSGIMKQAKCFEIDPDRFFGRAGLLPFTQYKGETLVFFNLFRGTDRGGRVMELSDLGGRAENMESFIRAACYEAFEETLGIFNFLGQESLIRATSVASYNEDRSLIVVPTPIAIKNNPLDIVREYSRIKEIINGTLEDLDTLPRRNMCERKLLPCTYNISCPILYNATSDTLPVAKGDKVERKRKFNANETAHLVYATVPQIKSLIAGKKCLMSEELNVATGSRYNHYPPLYFAILKHLEALLPFIESFNFSQLEFSSTEI